MHHLKEIVDIIAKYRIKDFDTLNDISAAAGKRSNYVKFYLMIHKDKLLTDEEASAYFFKEPPGERYWAFKHEFIIKLQNSLFHTDIDMPGIGGYGRAFLWCSKMSHWIVAMSFYSGQIMADVWCKKMLAKALKYELAEYVVAATTTLLEHAAFANGEDIYHENKAIHQKWLKIYLAEIQAKEYVREIKIAFAKTVTLKPEVASLAFEYAAAVKKSMEEHPTYTLQTNYYRLQAFGYEIAYQHEKRLETWEEMGLYLNSRTGFASNTLLGEVALQRMGSYLYLGQYEKGMACATECTELFRADTSLMLVFKEYHFLMAMHSANYALAGEIYASAASDPYLLQMPMVNQEKWKVYGAYAYYVSPLCKDPKNIFDCDKFLREIKEYRHDKAGLNAVASIICICILIRKKNTSAAIDKIDALRQYGTRYLKGGNNKRVDIFVQMLMTLYSQKPEKKEPMPNAAELLKELSTIKYHHTMNLDGMEIIPYEKMWQNVIGE